MTGADLLIGSGVIDRAPSVLPEGAGKVFLVSDENVCRLHGERAARAMSVGGRDVATFSFPPGEASKTRAMKERMEDWLIASGAQRDDVLAALGGGVTIDLAGFAASTLMRGIGWIGLPTSLLAMVDASIGGKVGVDTPMGKNLVGAFHDPLGVVMDTSTLATLPVDRWRDGLAEAVKTAAVLDGDLFEMMEEGTTGDPPFRDRIGELVRRCAAAKMSVVDRDAREMSLRRVLNFGHTVGHGIEASSGWTSSHGLAVSIGMVVESFLAEDLGVLEMGCRARIRRVLGSMGLPVRPSSPDPGEVLAYVRVDKKRAGGRIRVALPRRIGEAEDAGGTYAIEVSEEDIARAWSRAWSSPA